MSVHDMGLYFDGRCAVCGVWIESRGDWWSTLAEPLEDRGHVIVHARCVPEDRAHGFALEEADEGKSSRLVGGEEAAA